MPDLRATPTAGKRLSAADADAIRAQVIREPDANKKVTTMVSCLDPNEEPLATKYRAARANGREAYEITALSNTVLESGQDSPLPILIDGNTRDQVGAVQVTQDGRAIATFSRSEKGREAGQAFVTGDRALNVAYLNRGKSRIAAALSLRTVTDGKRHKEADMSDNLEILTLGEKYDRTSLARKAIREGKDISSFRHDLLKAIETKPLDDSDLAAPAYHGGGERTFNVANILRAEMTGDYSNAGYEREQSQEAARNYPSAPRGIVVPTEAILGRASITSTGNASGAVTTDLNASMFIDRLRPQSSVIAAGATVMTGLSRNFTVPKLAADTTAQWLAEGAAVTESSLDIGSISMSMKRVSASQSFTREALLQSQPNLDDLVRSNISTVLSQAIDLAGLEGTGASGQPTGILNTSGINTLTAAGNTITYAEALTALAAIEEDNISTNNAVFIMHPNDYARIAQTVVDAGSGKFVIDTPNNSILGRRVLQTTKATEGKVYLGAFEHLLVAMFGGVDLVVDPYTNAASAKIGITSHLMADVNVRHPQAFNLVTLTT
jgi:HK97 family phage major capsid protein